MAAAVSMGGCGYGMGGGESSVLGPNSSTLKIQGVEHTTVYPWLGQVIRTKLRDEVAARNLAVWVDSGNADYSIQIKVSNFTVRTALHDDERRAVLSTAMLQLEGVVRRSADNTEIWRSGLISYSDTVESVNEEQAADALAAQAVRILVSRMRQNF
ncbi:LPS assembly lipoprotein LptE [Desulfovibrio sp. OttesenSCG-928-C14]|nr:LPS assembly lipoprotein LptE [Desulfovibrio sp. OttesenSCG-928-C14]